MNRWLPCFLVGALALLLAAACNDTGASGGKVIATINDHELREDTFRRELESSPYYRDLKDISREEMRELVEKQIRKELLIQEAVRRGLDKEESFRKAIQNYWELTLMSTLLKQQAQSLQNEISVADEEIASRHAELAKVDPNLPPVEQMKEQLATEIQEEKKAEVLRLWVDELRNHAKVTIHKENLERLQQAL